MMLKLLKNDFIATGRIMGVIYVIVAGISAGTLISHYMKSGEDMTVVEAMGIALLLVVSLCLFVLTVVFVLSDFQKSLYGEQGYLTFTLPVKSWMILASKVIVATVWFVVALAALLASLWVTVVVLKEEILGENYDLIMGMINQISTVNVASMAVSAVIRIILYFVQFAFFTITVFFTSTVANTRHFQKKNIFWTIVLFVPIAGVVTKFAEFIDSKIVFSLFFIEGKLSLVTDNLEYMRLQANGNSPVDIASIFVYLILGAGVFFATHYIMSKKVNIR
ncbi:MAG: hypothetical protein IJZ88_03605 [Clostridia bacterium]|nr:hypothetical protein [Clostridia bacterium]